MSKSAAPVPAATPSRRLPPARAVCLPLGFALGLVAFAALPTVQESPRQMWSFVGAGTSLIAWGALLLFRSMRMGRTLALEVLLRPQHYVQACVNGSIFLYWGYYWRDVYENAHLIAAQLVFAYAFDALLTWSRRDTYALGFGPFPIIFSINLFLWFKPDWFYLQFVLVAVGFAAKELIRWNKGGGRTHIFNPSSFTLSLFSLGLILTGTTDRTYGLEITTSQLYPPHILLWIFLISLPVQFLFGVASMTLAAIATTWGFNLVYAEVTGAWFFVDSFIPIGVFLGMHLLFTDPSTAPRTDLGRILFGVLYGSGVLTLYALLADGGIPTFYDKLLCVPILNLSIQMIDRVARSLSRVDPGAWLERLVPGRRNLAYMGLWTVLFATMYSTTESQVTLVRANIMLEDGRVAEAIEHYRSLILDVPDHPEAHANLGYALVQDGHVTEAMPLLRRALDLDLEDPEALTNLGLTMMRIGETAAGERALGRVVELDPDDAVGHINLATALYSTGKLFAAVDEYHAALRARPDEPRALAALGWIQATHPQVRDPEVALRRALRATELTGLSDLAALDALAAAYAANGRFEQAIQTAKAAELLAVGSAPETVEGIRSRIALYQAGRAPVVNLR
ncbi:MAG: tetratricopeptide repeat protein [Acidobacteriota bacterium]|nr:tetratricopeptide repeat protein [Acidobacteriota bacterium]